MSRARDSFHDVAEEVIALEEEINEMHEKIRSLEIRKEELQQKCIHQFQGNAYYEKCLLCHKIEVLYY
ncbi:cytochrome c2 [Bacillus pakistanensis]|uniref:Cytochrome c2 n=1 Tax=Rossellomorea pakistanensis TaxID=992288 RepID=A0ABS2NGT8_9BACI|nr:serine protease [Bacillus pakistanensis]MBM7587052.1 cytochrome c2 [Bacillus pakistanensis]